MNMFEVWSERTKNFLFTFPFLLLPEEAARRYFSKKVFLNVLQYSQENTCVGVSFQKQIPTQVLSCEYCEIFKNTLFYRTPPVAAFVP